MVYPSRTWLPSFGGVGGGVQVCTTVPFCSRTGQVGVFGELFGNALSAAILEHIKSYVPVQYNQR